MFKAIGNLIGTVGGVALAPIALVLGVSIEVVKEAVNAGCKTTAEVAEFLRLK